MRPACTCLHASPYHHAAPDAAKHLHVFWYGPLNGARTKPSHGHREQRAADWVGGGGGGNGIAIVAALLIAGRAYTAIMLV